MAILSGDSKRPVWKYCQVISKRPLNKKDDHWFWSDKNRGFMIKLVIKDSGHLTFFFKLEEGIESGA